MYSAGLADRLTQRPLHEPFLLAFTASLVAGQQRLEGVFFMTVSDYSVTSGPYVSQ